MLTQDTRPYTAIDKDGRGVARDLMTAMDLVEKADGVTFSSLDHYAFLQVVRFESYGDPMAEPPAHFDINSNEGHPSEGLGQCIPSTFQENALPGYDVDIHDPVSNMIACLRYARKRYGSIQNIPGVKACHDKLGQNTYVGY